MPKVLNRDQTPGYISEHSPAYRGGYVTDVNRDYTPGILLQALVDALTPHGKYRAAVHAKAWAAYNGEHPRSLQKDTTDNTDDDVRINFPRLAIETGVTYLFGKPFTIQTGDETQTDMPEEELLDAFWKPTGDGLVRLQKASKYGGISGHVVVKLQPDPDKPGPPRLIVCNPTAFEAKTERDDADLVYEYDLLWAYDDASGTILRRQRHVKNDSGLSWTIVDEQAFIETAGQPPIWITLDSVTWAWPFPAVYDCQNLPDVGYYGAPDLTQDVIDLAYSGNRNASNLNRMVRLFAHPRYVGMGLGTLGAVTMRPGEFLNFPSDEAKVQALAEYGDIAGALQFGDSLRQAFMMLAHTPEVATGKLENIGQLSGLAIQILYGPLVARIELKRLTYGGLIDKVSAAVLAMGGYDPETPVALNWPEVVPTDPVAEGQSLIQDEQLGASKRTLLQKRGYDPDVEEQQRGAEQDAAIEAAQHLADRGEGPGGLAPQAE